MSHRVWALLGVSCLVLAACDEPPTPEAKPTASAAPAPAPSVAPAAAPEPAAEAPKPKKPKKTLADCPKGPNVTFDNPGVEAAVRLKLPKPEGDITIADLKRLKSFNGEAARLKLEELDVCVFSHMTGLKELVIGQGTYDDLSPIAGATQLESLIAGMNQVSDITPLAKMKKLDRLDLGRTQVKDITPLAGLTMLTELQLDSTPVEDITPLAKLTLLEDVTIKGTQVKDLSPLKDLKKLKKFDGRDTPADEDPMSFAALRANGVKIVN
ncbi:MAG TPA: leucine-rich repeat domain-containing protein [Polyangiaceae bacterium]|nr:leucine-rich repeat domain-containing protein [Polyangiaceae bacterium]